MKSNMNATVESKDECPLEQKWLTPRVTYEADVITLNTSRKFYIGLSDLILDLKSVIITISVILETDAVRKAQCFQNIFGVCKKLA